MWARKKPLGLFKEVVVEEHLKLIPLQLAPKQAVSPPLPKRFPLPSLKQAEYFRCQTFPVAAFNCDARSLLCRFCLVMLLSLAVVQLLWKSKLLLLKKKKGGGGGGAHC